MLSIGRIGAGDGYKYLTSQVASQDAPRRGERLLGYYERTGHPPGVWVGDQARRFELHGEVTEEPMEHLFGHCSHPTETLQTSTGASVLDTDGREVHVPLGRRMAEYRSIEERIKARVEALNRPLNDDEHAALLADETVKGQSQAVTGLDLTFSAPKSVSILWALGGHDVRDELRAAHEAAWHDALGWIETEVAATRLGRAGVAQVDVNGLCAAAFEHWYDRAGDPQLHTHVAVSAMVQTLDGRWRRLDSRALYRSAAAAGERYTARLMAEATERLGVGWRHRKSGRSDTLLPEIDGIDDEMIAEFSPRSAQVKANLARLVGEYKDRHGYAPDRATTARLAQEAVTEGRPKSQQRSWVDEQTSWRERAGRYLGVDARDVGDSVRAQTLVGRVEQDEGHGLALEDTVRTVLDRLEDTGATWSERDIQRHSTAALREAGIVDVHVAERLATDVMRHRESVPIRAHGPGGETPPLLRRRSGAGVFERAGEARFTTVRVIDAERRLAALAAASSVRQYDDLGEAELSNRLRQVGRQLGDLRRHQHDGVSDADRGIRDARTAELTETRAALIVEQARRRGRTPVQIGRYLEDLSEDQAAAVARLADTFRPLDALVGPAGAGKTTTLERLVRAWTDHGRGVVVLAPTAVAAEVIGDAVGVAGDTLDAALGRWERGDDLPGPGTLVLIDEASMATSPELSTVIETALVNGAIVRCVGDPRQLKAVGAGGGLTILAEAADSPVLTNMHRFQEPWEGQASLGIRDGNPEAIVEYEQHGRVGSGLEPKVIEEVYRAWRDSPAGPDGTLMIASDNETVRALGERARADRVAAGEVEADGLELADRSICGVGDVIVTRRNDRTIPTGGNAGAGGYVRNRDRWIVTARSDSGDLTVRHVRTKVETVLPADYVAEHVELSYAVTGHGAQGLTVDEAHAVIKSTDTRQYAYVAMTRGRALNQAHVVTGEIVDEPTGYEPDRTARSVLAQVLSNDEIVSARDHEHAAAARARDLFELVSRYRHAQTEEMLARVKPVLETVGAGGLLEQPHGWRLRQALETAEDRGFDAAELVRSVGVPGGVEEIALQVQRACWSRITPAGQPVRPQPLFGSLVPEPGAHVEKDVAAFLERLGRAIVDKRSELTDRFMVGDPPGWASGVGPAPGDPDDRQRWASDLAQIAIWREAQGIAEDDDLLGPTLPPGHRDARARAMAAAAAAGISADFRPPTPATEGRDFHPERSEPSAGPRLIRR